jgi:hypothetical protein
MQAAEFEAIIRQSFHRVSGAPRKWGYRGVI